MVAVTTALGLWAMMLTVGLLLLLGLSGLELLLQGSDVRLAVVVARQSGGAERAIVQLAHAGAVGQVAVVAFGAAVLQGHTQKRGKNLKHGKY